MLKWLAQRSWNTSQLSPIRCARSQKVWDIKPSPCFLVRPRHTQSIKFADRRTRLQKNTISTSAYPKASGDKQDSNGTETWIWRSGKFERLKMPPKGQKTVKKSVPADAAVEGAGSSETPSKGRKRQRKAESEAVESAGEETPSKKTAAKSAKSPKGAKSPKAAAATDPSKDSSPKKATPKKTPEEKVQLPRSVTKRVEAPIPGRRFALLSWNVNGLRPTLAKKTSILEHLKETEKPDLICLQEHKLQEKDVSASEAKLLEIFQGYKAHWSFSTEKKGYAGLVVLTKVGGGGGGAGGKQKTMDSFFKPSKKATTTTEQPTDSEQEQPLEVTLDMGIEKHDGEGRLVTVEYKQFFVVFVYVPNSGDGLKRLDYRINEWNADFRTYLKGLQDKKPVIVAGDLNVAHLDRDIWNVTASHIDKSAGTTPQERESHGVMLEDVGLTDTFRHLHADADHCYTYWSVRARNRPWNRGLRLDYCLASNSLINGAGSDDKAQAHVHDSFILDDAIGDLGDHCPVGCVLSL